MSKKLAIVLIIGALLLGAIFGHKIASRKYENAMQVSSENVASGFANNSIWLLNVLQTNNTSKAISNLEMNLDWDLIFLNMDMSNA